MAYRNYFRQNGNSYSFAQQAAKAVVNWKRFPRFTSLIEWIYWGPRFRRRLGPQFEWDDDYFRHGFSSQVPQLNYPNTGNDAENLRDITDNSGDKLMGVILMPATPAQMPDYLKIPYNALPDSGLKTEIGKYINQLIPVTDEAAARQMGQWMGDSIKNNQCGGKIPRWVSIDEESARVDLHPQGLDSLRYFVGYMYLGILEVCTTSRIYTYGPKPLFFPTYINYQGVNRDVDGEGKYFYERSTALNLWWNNGAGGGIDLASPMLRALKANGGGVAAGDHYWRNTIGMGTIYNRSGGNYVLNNGRRVMRTDNSNVTSFGRTFQIYGNDPNQFNNSEYEFYTNWLAEELAAEEANRWWMNGGVYAARKNDRSSDWTGVLLGDWYRTHTEEANAPGAGDSRPCNEQGLEMGAAFRTVMHDIGFLWHGEYLQRGPTSFDNQAIQFPGITSNQGGYTTSLGQFEFIIKGMHRASQFVERPWGNFYWVRAERGIRPVNDKSQEVHIRGRLSETENHLMIVAAYPVQDNQDTEAGIAGDVTRVYQWVAHPQFTSGATFFDITGRDTYIDCIQIQGVPAGVTILPQHLRFRFVTIYNDTITLTGNYNVRATNAEPMPALIPTP